MNFVSHFDTTFSDALVKQSDGVQWCLYPLNNPSSNEEEEETYLNNIVISAFGKEPRGGMGETNIEITYAVGMDVCEEIVTDIMNAMENKKSVDFEQEVDMKFLNVI
ncbi:6316_t:CDS:2, partial [Paraglomus brasilianum]